MNQCVCNKQLRRYCQLLKYMYLTLHIVIWLLWIYFAVTQYVYLSFVFICNWCMDTVLPTTSTAGSCINCLRHGSALGEADSSKYTCEC